MSQNAHFDPKKLILRMEHYIMNLVGNNKKKCIQNLIIHLDTVYCAITQTEFSAFDNKLVYRHKYLHFSIKYAVGTH